MGQQQILFVILAVCIVGIAISIGLISTTGHSLTDNRALVEQDLRTMAQKVQEFAHGSGEDRSEGLSFAVLSRLPDPLALIGCPSSNAHGDFFLKKSDRASSLQIIGVGIEAGLDAKRPLRMMITVWADSTALSVLN